MTQQDATAPNVIDFPKAKPSPRSKARARCVLAVGGGKGGIGKSLVSANLGIALARRGASVVLVDGDLGGANLHTCLGVAQPKRSLSDFIDRRVASLEEVLVPTGFERLSLISGAQDVLDAANVKHGAKLKLLRNVRTLDVDYVLLDLGAGTSFNVLDFWLTADHGLVVLLPEPTSIENSYRFIKAAFFRRLQQLQAEFEIADLVEQAMAGKPGVRTPFELFAQVHARSPEKASRLEAMLGAFRPWLVVNQARTRADYDIGPQVAAAWKKFFGLELGYLGAVAYDDAVWQSVRARRALLAAHPDSPAAQSLARVAENLLALKR